MCNNNTKYSLAHFLLLASMLVGSAMADSSKEKEECTEQIAGLTTCLPYVGGEAKTPTPDCCSGLRQVLKNNKKCLCVIIKDRNDPDLGSLQINLTLALSLPKVCNTPTNISKCPELLHMDPKSPDAQVFYQLDKNSSKGGTSLAPNPSVVASPASGKTEGGTGSRSASTQKNDAAGKKRLFGFEIFAEGIILVWLVMGLDARNIFTLTLI